MIYALLRWFVRLILAIFYRDIAVTGQADPGGPLVIVANHPNALMDPLLIAAQYNRRVSIIAKSTLFSNALVSHFLHSLGVLPVKRRVDSGNDPGQSNDSTFEACFDCLKDGGIILIFGEGTSHFEPRLMPLKTGPARIALGAEARHGPLGVHIMPAGLTYEAPETFDMKVRVRFGSPIPVLPYLKNKDDVFEDAKVLTQKAEDELTDELIHLKDPNNQDVLMAVDNWVGNDLESPELPRLDVVINIAKALNHFEQSDPERVSQFRQYLRDYNKILEELDIPDIDKDQLKGPSIFDKVLFFGLLPVYVWGAVNHWLPYRLPQLVVNISKAHPTYTSTIKLLTGVASFSLCYALQGGLVWYWLGWPLALAYVGTLPLAGMITLRLNDGLERWSATKAAQQKLEAADSGQIDKALKLRKTLMGELHKAVEEYLAAE